MIKLEKVKKYYNRKKRNEVRAIDDVTVAFDGKGIIGLYGKSGSGKTTLLNAIGGITDIDEGTITIDGNDLSTDTDNIRNRYIGYIFQNYCLSENETVYDNVADGLKLIGIRDEDIIKERVEDALKKVGMENYARRYPGTLSGGQQQRIAIARAIVKNPSVILADEPTGNLDKKNTKIVMDFLREFSKERLVLLVTHERDVVDEYCDLVFEISDGKIKSVRHKGEEKQEYNEAKLYKSNPDEESIRPDMQNDRKSEIIDEESGSNEKDYGRLFDFKDAMKIAKYNIANRRAKSRFLKVTLFIFALVLVVVTAYYSVSVRKFFNTDKLFERDIIYAYVEDKAAMEELNKATQNDESGIDALYVTSQENPGPGLYKLDKIKFESSYYGEQESSGDVITNFYGTFLPDDLMEDTKMVCGQMGTGIEDAVITTAVADMIMSETSYTFLDDYDKLIGLSCSDMSLSDVSENAFYITGIVKGSNCAIYRNDEYFVDARFIGDFDDRIQSESDASVNVDKGSVVARVYDENCIDAIKEGDTVQIYGNSFTVGRVENIICTYDKWLADNNIVKEDKSKTKYSDYEYYDYYYDRYTEYIDYCKDNPDKTYYNAYMKLYEMGYDEGLYCQLIEECGDFNYYVAHMFNKANGHYPDEEEFEEAMDEYDDLYETTDKLLYDNNLRFSYKSVDYVLDDDDYKNTASCLGDTSLVGISRSTDYGYLIIHSKNIKKTQSYLAGLLKKGDGGEFKKGFYLPDEVRERYVYAARKEAKDSFGMWSAIVIMLCLCVYGLMRSILASETKDIGTYRCIGAKRKNVVFYFMCETVIVMSKSAGAGFVIGSVVLWYMSYAGTFTNIASAIYYPVWLALIVFVIIGVLSCVIGLLPITKLLKNSPTDIMAKYDM